MISSREPSTLPDVPKLRTLMQSLATLDAILSPEWEYRYYSFNGRWNETEQMGSMRNGAGDDLFVVFGPAGCFVKGFAHEARMARPPEGGPGVWPGVLDAVPGDFRHCLSEPAFDMEAVTFCLWRRGVDATWQRGDVAYPEGDDPDGSEYLLAMFDAVPETYQEWAQEYYEAPVDLAAIRAVYEHVPLTEDLVRRLNPELTLAALAEDLAEIGYPVG